MRGAIGFLVGIIGLCLFAAASLLIPIVLNRSEGMVMLLAVMLIAFVFLNILIVGFFRMLGHLHETVLYPDDPSYHPPRGRILFFVGYIGLLVMLVFVVLLATLPELMRWRIRQRDIEPLLLIAWFVGWAFFGCMLGGVLMQLSDIFHKAYYRTMMRPPDAGGDDDYDITRPRQRSRAAEDNERPRRWDDE